MELKKYVMLNNKVIVDTTTEIYYLRGEAQLYRDRPNACRVTVCMGNVLKTSDNILDLVESMDLIGCKVNNPFINNQIIYMVIDNPIFLADLVFFLVNGDKVWFRDSQYDDEEKYADIKRNRIEIISIYKLQPNGDYKKYEVK